MRLGRRIDVGFWVVMHSVVFWDRFCQVGLTVMLRWARGWGIFRWSYECSSTQTRNALRRYALQRTILSMSILWLNPLLNASNRVPARPCICSHASCIAR